MKRELSHVQRELEKQGWSVEIKITRRGGDITLLSRQAADEGLDAVWVAGGDGSLNEAVNGLVGSQTTLAVLPAGTGNIWARQLRLPILNLTHPLAFREAAAAQSRGRVRAIDVGLLNDRYFLLWAGVGFDAFVTRELEPRHRATKRLGALPYAIAAVFMAREFSGVRARIVVDGRVIRGRTIMVVSSNVQMYGYFHLTSQARLDDGLLDVFVFKGLGFPYIIRHAAQMFSGRHLQDPRVVHRQAREITIWTKEPMATQVDGDPVGITPVSLRVVPRALRILVPPQTPQTLFSREEL
jgi:YegS/Rv2252/BmrU family lipid kinase